MAKPQSNKSPAFQFYPKEFLSSSKVIAMSATERGAYITLLSVQWLDGSLPNDLPALARLSGVAPKPFARMWPHNLARCFVLRNGRFVNERLERERKKQAEYRQRQASNSAKAWDSRKHGSGVASHATANALLLRTASPISDLQPEGKTPSGRMTPIQGRRRLDAAWEGPRVYVPQRCHSDFVALRNGAESELFAWYAETSEAWTDGPFKASETGPDMFAFWKARYAEKWPVPKVDKRIPEWAR